MNKELLLSLKSFLAHHYDRSSPLLLALSGGPDSLALFYLLEKLRERASFPLHIAHVDHGWREESKNEAEQLEELALKRAIPFHLHTLTPPKQTFNLEERAREERLSFFSKLFSQLGPQAIFLAHTQEDQAETVFKRLLEGASLPNCRGMQMISEQEGMTIWRPLLPFKKTQLLDFLAKIGADPFIDSSNFDPRYTRVRLRQSILPIVEEEFGKNIQVNLARFGTEAHELNIFLNHYLAPYLARIEQKKGVSFLKLQESLPRFALKGLVKQAAQQELGITLSRSMIEQIVEALETKKSNAVFRAKEKELIADRGTLFFQKSDSQN